MCWIWWRCLAGHGRNHTRILSIWELQVVQIRAHCPNHSHLISTNTCSYQAIRVWDMPCSGYLGCGASHRAQSLRGGEDLWFLCNGFQISRIRCGHGVRRLPWKLGNWGQFGWEFLRQKKNGRSQWVVENGGGRSTRCFSTTNKSGRFFLGPMSRWNLDGCWMYPAVAIGCKSTVCKSKALKTTTKNNNKKQQHLVF